MIQELCEKTQPTPRGRKVGGWQCGSKVWSCEGWSRIALGNDNLQVWLLSYFML